MISLLEKDWFRPLKNAGIVGAGKGMQGIVSLIALALAARQLGPETFGFFVLIHGMVFGVSQIIRFQSWQAVLKFGAVAQGAVDAPRLQKLIRFTFTLDILSAIFGTLFMVAIAGPLARTFSLPEEQIWLAQMYSFSIAFMLLTPTQLGVLRLYDRFDLVATQTIIGPFIRFLGTLFLFFALPDAGLFEYLALWFVGSLIARQSMFIMAQREMRRHGYDARNFLPVNPFRPPEQGIWSFIIGHNVFRSFYVSHEQIGLLMVGWLLGPAAAGIFRIAQKFAGIMIKPTEKLLVPALYPELAKFQVDGNKTARRKMITSNLMVIGFISLVLFAFLVLMGEWLIIVFSGAEYVSAYMPMIVLCIAGLVTILSYPLEPLLSAASKVRHLVVAYGVGLAVYIIALYGLTDKIELVGAALAALLAVCVSTILMFLFRPRS